MRRIPLACLAAGLLLGVGAQAAAAEVCTAQPQSAAAQSARKVGEEVLLTRESPHPYLAAPVRGQSGPLHADTLTYPGAAYIAPHFSRLELEPGDYLIVRSPDWSRSWRYDDSHPGAREGFWAIHIPGDTAIVELYGSEASPRRGVLNKYGYRIDKFARGYSNEEMGTSDFGTQALCGADDSNWARCYEGEPIIYNHARPVARLLINGTGACTGWLVGNQGHLLTNQHCIGTAAVAQNTSYEFLAEGATCATSCASWFGCPGTVVATSATLVKVDAPRDYALVQLPTNPTATYGYLQLRNSGAVVNERIYIPQHPAAHGKKIAVQSSHSTDASGYAEVYSLNEAACQSGGPSDVGYYADTQGGSSGSPVIGYSDHQVVALHHCANCPNRGVPIQAVISHLGTSLPTCALRSTSCPDPIGSGTPPPPPPPPPPPANSFTFSATNTNNAQQNTVNQTITVNAGDTVEVGTCGLTGATFSGDTYLRAFYGATQVAANDDSCGGLGSFFRYVVAAGQGGSHQIRAGCYSTGSCSGTVVWRVTPGTTSSGGTSGSFDFGATHTHSAK